MGVWPPVTTSHVLKQSGLTQVWWQQTTQLAIPPVGSSPLPPSLELGVKAAQQALRAK